MGIIIGLMGFDATNAESIDASIGALLEGLKTAFITSLVGMAAAIIYKLITSIVPPVSSLFRKSTDTSSSEVQDASGNDLLKAIEQGNAQQTAHQTAQHRELEKLNKALSGDGDSSLSTLIGKQRLESREFNEALCTRLDRLQSTNQTMAESLEKHRVKLTEDLSVFNSTAQQQLEAMQTIEQGVSQQEVRFERFATDLEQQLKDFAEMLSKSATEQMIEALKNVIAEFNNTLTEQFGENFKALDASVKKLVDWQENYKEQLGDMRAHFDLSVKALADSEQSVSHISQSAAAIPETMSGMQTLLETSRHQIDELERHLGAFVEMRDKAVEAVPQMQQQVEVSVRDVTQAASTASQGLEKSARSLIDASEGFAKETQAMLEQLKQGGLDTSMLIETIQVKVQDGTEKMQKRLTQSFEDITSTQSEQMNKAYQQMAGLIEDAAKKGSESVQAQAQQLDESMQEEINRVMQTMGTALVQIAGRFTEDYRSLTAQMQQVVSSARDEERMT
ncbi:hypothetical protein [Halomonas sp.]|uniref:hypothetical protein n=1 Tax=Halomonas sp. TaxID=1486246 RepID=UPI003A953EFC